MKILEEHKLKKPIWLIIILTLFFLSGCKKDASFYNFRSAIIVNGGDASVDGCGWLIEISGCIYKPINLQKEFLIDGLHVKLQYDVVDEKGNCGWQQNVFDQIDIVRIEKN